jgi:hypothetical protein
MKKIITVLLLTIGLSANAFWNNNGPWGGYNNGPWGYNDNGIFGFNPYSFGDPRWFVEEMENMMDEFGVGNNWNNNGPWGGYNNGPWGGYNNGPWGGYNNGPWGGYNNGAWGNNMVPISSYNNNPWGSNNLNITNPANLLNGQPSLPSTDSIVEIVN